MTTTLAHEHDASADRPGLRRMVHRHRWLIGGVALSALLVGLVYVASLPTGTDSPERTVATGSRLAAQAAVDEVEVMVISSHGDLSVQVAYESAKGWLAAALPSAPANSIAAWTGTKGSGPIPALSAVFGRAPGTSLEIAWADGERTTVDTASDGVFLAVRDRYVIATLVRVLDASGATILEIEGL